MAAFAISVDGLSPSHRTSYTVTSGNAPLGTLTWSATGPIGNTTFRLEVFDGYVTRASSTTFTITVANEVLTFLHPNVTGSPIMATDASGAVLWREDYQAYGERIRKESGSTSANGSNPATAPAANNRAWFTGKLHDETTGLSYFGARYYDPQVGRFMGFDPVGFDEKSPLSFNRYAYANNNPLKFVDPDGRNPALAEALGLAGRAYGPAAGPAILGGGVAPACGPTCGMIPGQAQAPQLPQIMSNPIQVVTGLIMSTPINIVQALQIIASMTIPVKDLDLLHSPATIGNRPDLSKLTDKELMNSVTNPTRGDRLTISTTTGKLVDGNSRARELQLRSTDPKSSITPDTKVPVDKHTPNNDGFPD